MRGAAVIGTFFALVGVTLIASDPLRQVPPPLTSVLAVVGGSVCFAQALVIVRWFPCVQPVTMNAVGMTTGALVLLAASMIAGDPFVLPQRRESWLAIGYLVVIGSIAVFLLYLMVLLYWGGDARRVRVRDHRVRDCSAVRMARRRTGHLGLDAPMTFP